MVSIILYVLAAVLFLVAMFTNGVHLDSAGDLSLLALACFAAAHLPFGDWVNRS